MNTESKIYTIAFYNIENLFDTENDPLTHDDDFLPTSRKRWTPKRYDKKIRKLGTVISKIKNNDTDIPTIIGLAEVENKKVLSDLIKSDSLENTLYDFVHYDSPDERGIDVALLYNKNVFTVLDSETYSIYLQDQDGERDYTRDILLVKGLINGNIIYILVNHWPSRRGGEKETAHKRIIAAKKINSILQTLRIEDKNAKIIVMGDFNDNPNSESLKLIEEKSHLFNPFKTVWSHDKGSLNHNFQWHLFDQILCSTNFFNSNTCELSFHGADIFDPKYLTQYSGRYEGQPFRTFTGKKYRGGYSDHFPVFLQLKYNP